MRALLGVVLVIGCGGGPTDTTPHAMEAAIECGSGTMQVGTECVATSPTCGEATHEDNGACVADGRFALRVPTSIVADGYTPVILSVVGHTVPARVRITTDAAAGKLASATVLLGQLAGGTSFTPCSSAVTGCPTTMHVTATLASDPSVLDERDIALVPPTPVASFTPCAGGGNVIFAEGSNGYSKTFTSGTFDPSGATNRVRVNFVPTDLGAASAFTFTTAKLDIPMFPSVFPDAEFSVTPSYRRPGMTVQLPDMPTQACDPIGDFQILAFSESLGVIHEISATFEMRCRFDTTKFVHGCVTWSEQ